MNGLPVADSSMPVTQAMIDNATALFGQTPAAWGRYFTSPTTKGNIEYRHAIENPILASNNIRLLPVARQTRNVGGSQAQGASDAQGNVADFLATFAQQYLASQGGEFLMFLDVEGTPDNGSPSLSLSYYLGWADTLRSYSNGQTNGTVTIQPCVYARQGDSDTWNVVAEAATQGTACNGAWVARYWTGNCTLEQWNDSIVMPKVALPCSVLLWQYAENCCDGAIDSSQTNPSIDVQTEFLNRLVLPPS